MTPKRTTVSAFNCALKDQTVIQDLLSVFSFHWSVLLSELSTLGKKATVPIYKVLVKPDRESNSRPPSANEGVHTTRARGGPSLQLPL